MRNFVSAFAAISLLAAAVYAQSLAKASGHSASMSGDYRSGHFAAGWSAPDGDLSAPTCDGLVAAYQ